jgi:hypothetical protein
MAILKRYAWFSWKFGIVSLTSRSLKLLWMRRR